MNVIELSSQNLLTAIAATGTGVSLLSPDGDVLQSNHYWGDTILNLASIRKYADNEFYFATGYWKDTCTYGSFGVITQVYPVIGRMDSLGNVLTFRHYILNTQACMGFPYDMEITSDKGVILWGGVYYVFKTDSTGFPVWAKYFGGKGGIQFVRELPGGDLVAGFNLDTAGAVLARLDPDGNFIWCKSYIRPKGMIHDCLIESDSSFILIGTTDSLATTNALDPLPPGYHPKLFMLKLDGAGDVQWCKGYDSDPNLWYPRYGSRIVRAQDNNYVVLANLGAVGYNKEYRPFLMKTDTNGDTLWTRSTGTNGYTYLTADLLAHSDGGFLYDGVVYGNLPGSSTGAAYIFKTDSLGQLPCQNRWHPIEVSDLFPTDSSFTITSVDGATMMPAFVSDTVFDPIPVYDACLVTTVPQQPMGRHGNRMSVRPNPTTGRVTMEFDDPLTVDSFYSVYDALGRLLYQRPLPTGATIQEIDLSRFGKGTYVIKVTDREGVCYERVVLE